MTIKEVTILEVIGRFLELALYIPRDLVNLITKRKIGIFPLESVNTFR